MIKPSTETTQSFIDGLDGFVVKAKKAPKLAQKIPLDKIVPDPDQPRREFDKAELDELAASIRANGVLTPIAVQPAAEDGTHMLVFGERRFRAAKLAGLTEIVSTIIDPATTNIRTVQLIENLQRTNLSTEEIAAAIEALAKEGNKGTEIARLLGLPPARITEYRAILTMPPKLRALSDTVGARTLYQLFVLWKKDGPSVERFIETQGPNGITRAHVDALSTRLKPAKADSKPEEAATASEAPAPDGEDAQEPQGRPAEPEPSRGAPAPEVVPQSAAQLERPIGSEGKTPPLAPAAIRKEANTAPPSWIVKHGDAFGRLLTDQIGPDSKTAVVAFDNGKDVRPVALGELTLFEIVGE